MDEDVRLQLCKLGLAARGRQRGVSGFPQVTIVRDAAQQGADDVGEGQGAEGEEQDSAGVQFEAAGGRGEGLVRHGVRIDPRNVAGQASDA
jgi:hypothetical protein